MAVCVPGNAQKLWLVFLLDPTKWWLPSWKLKKYKTHIDVVPDPNSTDGVECLEQFPQLAYDTSCSIVKTGLSRHFWWVK